MFIFSLGFGDEFFDNDEDHGTGGEAKGIREDGSHI